jgi:chromosome partitioning protein
MVTISLANQKGGVGKSTLCACLAVASGDALIVDVDPQATVSQWFEARPQDRDLPECAKARPADVSRIVSASLRKWIFIDTAGDLSAQQAIDASDLCIVPVRPSIHDLRAAAATVKLLASRRGVFVLNAAPTARWLAENPIVKEAREALKAFKLPVCPVVVRQRAAYVHTAVAGLGVTEWTDRKAAEEIRELWQWLSVL